MSRDRFTVAEDAVVALDLERARDVRGAHHTYWVARVLALRLCRDPGEDTRVVAVEVGDSVGTPGHVCVDARDGGDAPARSAAAHEHGVNSGAAGVVGGPGVTVRIATQPSPRRRVARAAAGCW